MQIDEYLKAQDFSPSTKAGYRMDLRAFFDFSGGEMPNTTNVRKWIDHLKKKNRRDSHIQRCIYALKGYCQWMGIDIFAGPREKNKYKIQVPRMKFKDLPPVLSVEDVNRLFRECRTPRDTMLLMLLSTTGARIGELMKVKVTDINWEKNMIALIRKGNRERRQWLSLSEATMKSMNDYLDWRHTNSPLLLPFSYYELRRSLQAIAKRAEVKFPPGSLFHNFRHLFILIQKDADIPLEVISLAVGHSSTHTTSRIYGKLSPEFIRSRLHPTPWDNIDV